MFCFGVFMFNVLSNYLWAKAVLFFDNDHGGVSRADHTGSTGTAIVDSLSGNKPSFTNFIGAAAVMVGFAGINNPSELFYRSKQTSIEIDQEHRSRILLRLCRIG